MTVIEFWVGSKPYAKGRPRVTRNGTYTPKTTRDAEKAVRTAWRLAGGHALPEGFAIRATLAFYLERPRNHYRTNGQLNAEGERNPIPICGSRKNADIDNYAKTILDALNGCAYPDDGAITELRVTKEWEAPGSKPDTYVSLLALAANAETAIPDEAPQTRAATGPVDTMGGEKKSRDAA